jgi:hypothetical protein
MEQQQTKYPYIPNEAFLYFPPPNEIMNAKGRHEIFGGNVKYTEYETKMIQEFKNYAAKNGFEVRPDYWPDDAILRFLTADEFKMTRTLEDVKEHSYWRDTLCPIQLSDRLKNFLNDGLLYIAGRDNKFRPIIVFNVNRIDAKQFDLNFMITAMTFWLKTVIEEWMLPGQVEQWVFIGNIKGMGIGALAVQEVRKLFEFLQTNFKCRLHKIYLVNAARTVYAPWKIAKKFLDGDTQEKVQFSKTSVPENLFHHAHRDQVEQQFGGNAPNITQYWPPKIPSNNYFVSPNDRNFLKTPEQWVALYKSGALTNMKVNEAFLKGGVSNMSQSANITKPTGTQQQQPLSQSANISKPQIPAYESQGSLGLGLNDHTPMGLVTKSLNELDFQDKEKKPWGVESQPTLSTASIGDFYDNMNGGKKDEKEEKIDDEIPFDLLPWGKKLELWRGFSSQADYVEEMGEGEGTDEGRRLPAFNANVKFDDLLRDPQIIANFDVSDA